MKRTKAIDCTPALNTIKSAYMMADKSFSKAQFIQLWKDSGLPYYHFTWKCVFEFALIIRIGKGIYKFASEEPVYHGKLQAILDKAYEQNRKYYITSKPETEVKELIEDTLEERLKQAATLLKEHNYIVLKPKTTVTYERI